MAVLQPIYPSSYPILQNIVLLNLLRAQKLDFAFLTLENGNK